MARQPLLLPNVLRGLFATDASEEQIGQSQRHPRVEYVLAPAERCPLSDGSVNLVTVAQALHWFDLSGFYREVNRVCRPGGLSGRLDL